MGTIIAFIFIRRIIKDDNTANKTIVISRTLLIGFVALFIFSKYILLGDYSFPSRVNATPLYSIGDITFIEFEDMQTVIDIIERRDDFYPVRFRENELLRNYSFGWRDNLKQWEPGGVGIELWYFDSIDEAKTRYRGFPGKHIHVKVSDVIEAKLYNSIMYRSFDSFYVANWRKTMYTHVLVGNAIIFIRENENFINIGKWTNRSLVELCDILHEVMIEEKKSTAEESDLQNIETD